MKLIDVCFFIAGLLLLITGTFMLWGAYSLVAAGAALVGFSLIPSKKNKGDINGI